MEKYQSALFFYVCVINITAVLITVYDKKRAEKRKWRVPEATLLLICAIGGSPAMYITMRLIHHKTRKKKFMVGIPCIFAAQAACAVFWAKYIL